MIDRCLKVSSTPGSAGRRVRDRPRLCSLVSSYGRYPGDRPRVCAFVRSTRISTPRCARRPWPTTVPQKTRLPKASSWVARETRLGSRDRASRFGIPSGCHALGGSIPTGSSLSRLPRDTTRWELVGWTLASDAAGLLPCLPWCPCGAEKTV